MIWLFYLTLQGKIYQSGVPFLDFKVVHSCVKKCLVPILFPVFSMFFTLKFVTVKVCKNICKDHQLL